VLRRRSRILLVEPGPQRDATPALAPRAPSLSALAPGRPDPKTPAPGAPDPKALAPSLMFNIDGVSKNVTIATVSYFSHLILKQFEEGIRRKNVLTFMLTYACFKKVGFVPI
jgi:hypothetical protein